MHAGGPHAENSLRRLHESDTVPDAANIEPRIALCAAAAHEPIIRGAGHRIVPMQPADARMQRMAWSRVRAGTILMP